MAKLALQFKEKHLCFCANFLKKIVAANSFEILSELKTKVKGLELQPDDLVTVEVTASAVASIYDGLGQLPERLANSNNTEMAESLTLQLTTLAERVDEIGDEARAAIEGIGVLRERNLAMQASYEQEGRGWLNM